MSSLKDRLAALTPEQRRELAQRLKQQSAPAQKPAQPERRKEGVFPLGENQWGLWFLHQMAPASSSYNVALALRVRGRADLAALQRCLDLLAERHAILRTTYETQEHKPVQRVHERLPLALTRHDVPGLTEDQLDEALRASYVQPFDLERGPVWRADLFSRAPTEHVLLLVIHHIATDLWSMGMMMEELQHLYRGELRGEPLRLPPLKLDYVDALQLRREQMTPAREERLWAYWQEQMRELPGPLELPTDKPRPARWSFRGATLPMRLGPELSAGLKSLALTEGKTLFTVLLAGFLTLLHRYTGQSDLLCGTPLWGRTHPDLQRLAGYFVNFVALRGDLSGDPSFTELVERLYRRVLGAIEHQDYPFHVLSERLGIKQDPSRPRLVEVEFSFDQFNSMPGLDVARDDVQMELKPFLRQQEGQYAINIMLVDVAGEVAGALKYNTDLFTPETMARFAAQLRALFTSVLRNPRQRLSALSLMTEAERRQVLEGLGDWQRQRLAGSALEQQLGYWRQALAGVTPLELPTDRSRTAVRGSQVARWTFSLPGPLAEGLRALAREEDATLSVVLLGAFQALLHRYSGQDDITVGAPVVVRAQPGQEGRADSFVNTLVLRTRLGGDPTFRELLARAKETTLAAHRHQDFPFQALVRALDPARELSQEPLFQVALVLQDVPTAVPVDLSLSLREGAEGLTGWLEYSTELYEEETVERLAGHYQRLLESAVAQPDTHVSGLELLGEEERRRVVEEWNGLLPAPQVEGGLHELFEA
ncbi:condensation domain-containing protein, partial [Myxococcus sp. K15C18031901]|uniref:condensation domain-containing protein n=1 Tax=Myxococcus dinghuensis TaxID=2906761 RepID=UPI0020A7D884